jgi:hypothetical protein
MAGWALAGALALGCDSALQVEDPQTFSDDDLNSPTILKNVGDGVEGQFHQVLDDVIVFTGLLSDEMEDTSTWIDWADVSLGRVRGDWPSVPGFATTQNELLRNRFAAQNAAERIKKVLGDADAAKSVTLAQVQTTEAWDDLILGMAYCEAPLIANGPRATDAELIKQAVTKFTTALATASSVGAGAAVYTNWATAGRARANLLAGNYDAALTDARAVPAGFLRQALYAEGVAVSFPGDQFHQNRNRSGSLRRIWWPMVDTTGNNATPAPTQYVKDPWTQQNDLRMAVLHPRGRLGVNNNTPHYSIEKYNNRANPITITSKREMNLIEAEVLWRKNDFDGAIAAMNRNRTTTPSPNLPAFTKAGAWTQQEVLDRLLSERFAELFVEGHRLTDLNRFNLITTRLGTGRATKLPMSRTEILNNSSMKEGEAKCPGIS